jgi:hypothetical protein
MVTWLMDGGDFISIEAAFILHLARWHEFGALAQR